MRRIFDSAFARSVSVTDEAGTYAARAFIRPAAISEAESPELSPAGVRDRRRWRIILEPMELTGAVTVTDGAQEFFLLRREMIGGGDHIEGLLCLKAGETDAG